uniref:Tc1-like transposase DDE domain-containing protein n=1 Tax=Esox lucius TaxID=8010 RepID=A0AAY5L4Z8_ESOLU
MKKPGYNMPDHLDTPHSLWFTVIWTVYETKIELYGHNHKRYVLRGVNKAYSEQNTIPTVKHGGGSLRFWVCVSSKGTCNLVKIDGKMNEACDQKKLADNLHSSAQKLCIGRSWTFQHDNETKHKAKLTLQCLQQKKVNVLEWPSRLLTIISSSHSGEISNVWFMQDYQRPGSILPR